jgi:DNA-directed RNA polymerase specialized sigma24 family protein
VLKFRQNSGKAISSEAGLPGEQYASGVFRYVSYWVKNTHLAEELTIKALRKTLARYGSCTGNEYKFSIVLFTTVRKDIHDYFRASANTAVLPGLSSQEHEVISLKLGAVLDNRKISKILGLPESSISRITYQSLCKLRNCQDIIKSQP